MRTRWEARAVLETKAATILQELSDSTRGRTEDMLAYQLPLSAKLEDSGARINLNWVRAYILTDSPVLQSLFTGGSPGALQAFRQKTRLGTRIEAYSGFFDRASLDRYFTAKSLLNVNTVDEFAFENVMAQATSSPSSGASWRERLRALRLSNTVVKSEGELRAWFGTDWDKVSLFVTVTPEWNANTLDASLLGAVLACSDFALADPASAASALVEARTRHYLGDSDIRTILGLPQDNPIWVYLGTESTTWTLSVSSDSGLRIEVDFARRGETKSGGPFEIRAKRWSHA